MQIQNPFDRKEYENLSNSRHYCKFKESRECEIGKRSRNSCKNCKFEEDLNHFDHRLQRGE